MDLKGGNAGRLETAFTFALAAAALALAYWLIHVWLWLFLALLIAILLDAIASLGIRFLKLRRSVAVVLATLIVLAGTGGTLAFILVPLAKQATEFIQTVPKRLAHFDTKVAQLREEFPWAEKFLPMTSDLNQESTSNNSQLAKKALVTVSMALDRGATALAVFFLGLFLAMDPGRWLRGMAELWPGPDVENRVALFRRMGEGLRSYLAMMGIYMVVMGVAWAVGLWLIGIPFPLLFGTIGGLVEVVPYVGPMLGLIPPLLFAFSGGASKIMFVLLLYLILHVLEGYVLVPFLMSRREHLPPPLVVLSILICGKLFGTLGVVLAVPLATAGYVLTKETVYARRERHRTRSGARETA